MCKKGENIKVQTSHILLKQPQLHPKLMAPSIFGNLIILRNGGSLSLRTWKNRSWDFSLPLVLWPRKFRRGGWKGFLARGWVGALACCGLAVALVFLSSVDGKWAGRQGSYPLIHTGAGQQWRRASGPGEDCGRLEGTATPRSPAVRMLPGWMQACQTERLRFLKRNWNFEFIFGHNLWHAGS